MSSSSHALKRVLRPPFPSGWAAIPLSPRDLTLANTLPVGQSFLWHRHRLPEAERGRDGQAGSAAASAATPVEEFARAVDNPPRVVCLRQTDAALYYAAVYPAVANGAGSEWDADQAAGTTRRWLDDYFQLANYPDLPGLYAEWCARDPKFFGTVNPQGGAVGVRVLRQDPWECLVAFITSANNNISRITSLLHKLCERFSPPVLSLEDPDHDDLEATANNASGRNTTKYRLFPAASALPQDGLEPILRDLGFGYRAGYLATSLDLLRERCPGSVEAELTRWRTLPLPELREELLRLKGVGRKVADCVMLMCMDQSSIVPIDTHIYTIATRHPALPSRLHKPKFASNIYDDVQAFLADAWGPRAGWCQAVVFADSVSKPVQAKPAKAGKAGKADKKAATGTPQKASAVSVAVKEAVEMVVEEVAVVLVNDSISNGDDSDCKPEAASSRRLAAKRDRMDASPSTPASKRTRSTRSTRGS